jgi:hypothetical protein
VSGPFPRIPTLAPRGIEETPRAFGLRAFEFLLRERVVAAVLDTDVLEQALAASHLIVVASEMADTVREQIHTVRLDMAATIDRRLREQRELAAGATRNAARPTRPIQPGRLRGPVPIRPTSPAVVNPF